ncbi:MAG TPA: DUF4398 domain-containing protein [Vicinamibacterales bacterium]|nr:DUF4398 domain-containing protein [Vicinamibacterales bacterium]
MLLTSACGDPPDKELQQARSAIESARGAGAEVYARDEFSAAETALKSATEAVDQRDYRLALNRALDARERAQNAAQEAASRKAAARTETSRAVAAAGRALDEARVRLKAAEGARVAAKVVAAARRTIADNEVAVQEARTAFGQGDFAHATEVASAATTQLRALAKELESATAPPSRRRR